MEYTIFIKDKNGNMRETKDMNALQPGEVAMLWPHVAHCMKCGSVSVYGAT